MTLDTLFALANLAVLLGWAILLLAPRWRHGATLVSAVLIPCLLAAVYLGLMIAFWGDGEGGFGSLEAIRQLFQTPGLLLAGWLHYLTFDLFIGSWQVRDAQANGISHWLVVPCLLLTLFLGPIGLLGYLALRSARTRSAALAAETH